MSLLLRWSSGQQQQQQQRARCLCGSSVRLDIALLWPMRFRRWPLLLAQLSGLLLYGCSVLAAWYGTSFGGHSLLRVFWRDFLSPAVFVTLLPGFFSEGLTTTTTTTVAAKAPWTLTTTKRQKTHDLFDERKLPLKYSREIGWCIESMFLVEAFVVAFTCGAVHHDNPPSPIAHHQHSSSRPRRLGRPLTRSLQEVGSHEPSESLSSMNAMELEYRSWLHHVDAKQELSRNIPTFFGVLHKEGINV
jgi:hypothetical protein